MKKVALIFGSWLSAPTGASRVVKSILENPGFKDNGIEFVSYSMDNIQPRKFYTKEQNKKNVRDYIKNLLNYLAQYVDLFGYFMVDKIYMRHSRALVNAYIKEHNNIDTVFFHDLYTCYYFLKYRGYAKRIVLVLHTNGETLKMEKQYFKCLAAPNSWAMKRLISIYNYTITNVSDICFVAKAPSELFCKLNPEIPKEKVHFVYNGLPDVNELNTPANHRIKEIVCVGSVTERKGQRLLIESCIRVGEIKKLDFHITIVGDGVIRTDLENMIIKAGLSDYVSFVGFSNEVDKYLRSADIFILPSFDEGFPMSILEAMRLSLPIISTNIAGIPEMLINNYNGLLIEPCVDDIYNILIDINSYNWIEMGNNSRKFFLQNFLIDSMVTKYSNILNN